MHDQVGSLRKQVRIQWFTMAFGLLALMLNVSGCLSPLAIHQAVMAYDHTVNQIEAEMLLLNIARARHHLPAHYTTVTSVAATFDFRSNAGIGGQIFGNPTPDSREANLLMMNLGVSVGESPTVTIIPIQGEEFTNRILGKLDETKFWFLYRQELDPGLLVRLMAREIQVIIEGEAEPRLYHNLPHHPEEYSEFRRRALHLSGLECQHKLRIGPLLYHNTWPLSPDHPLTTQALDQGFEWSASQEDEPPSLSKLITGRIIITNYDPALLSNSERRALDQEARRYPVDHILVDIRPGFPGGEYPWRGRIDLRSFDEILIFLGRGIQEDPEFVVEPDPRTSGVFYNPPKILDIRESDTRPPDAIFAVPLENRWYSVQGPSPTVIKGAQNLDVFRILSQLYQMTVIDVERVPTLPITIGK